MKYWIGFVVALIFAACTWALKSFAATHALLVDIVYPYISRMIQSFLSAKAGRTDICIWQVLVVIAGLLIIAAIIFYIWRKKNPIRWISWTLALICALNLLSTGLFGLNRYSGALSDDIRLKTADYAPTDLQNALIYYQKHANALAETLPRDKNGDVIADFDAVTAKAGKGFKVLSEEKYYSVFAGNTAPVKKMGWSWVYNITGNTTQFYPITGEAVVNENTPTVGLPFAVCRVMSQRICIANNPDSALASILACINNPDPVFQYSGYFMAYRYCYEALSSVPGGAASFRAQENTQLKHDVDSYNKSFAQRDDRSSGQVIQENGQMKNIHAADLLVSWHLQTVVEPMHKQEENQFDPFKVDLTEPTEATKPTEGK